MEELKASILFNTISSRYTQVNKYISFGLDKKARKLAIELLCLRDTSSVLDLFCGQAENVVLINEGYKTKEIDAIDFNESMLSMARKKLPSAAAQIIHDDFFKHNFHDKKYDAIVSSFGIKCIDANQFPALLNKLQRLLKPEGKIVFVEIVWSQLKGLNWLFKVYFELIVQWQSKGNEVMQKDFNLLINYMNVFDEEQFIQAITQAEFNYKRTKTSIPFIRMYELY